LALDFLGHAVLLASYWRATAQYWRPPSELFRLIPVGYASFGVYCVGLVWLLVRLADGSPSVGGGLRFGAAAGLLYWGSFALGAFSVFAMPISAVLYWTLCGTVESAIAAAVAAWTFSAERPWRRVFWALLVALGIFGVGVLLQNLTGLSAPPVRSSNAPIEKGAARGSLFFSV
jgi:hypothetical protein